MKNLYLSFTEMNISTTIEKDDIIVSGARSTGMFHIGNYLGAVQKFVNLSKEFDNQKFFFIADLHSLTTHTDADELARNNFITLATYLGCGISPDNANIYFQSDLEYTAELYLYLNMFAQKGELERTVTFKEKIRKHSNNVNAGLLTYPVLMAADILIHKGTKVPVGKDQAQHVEMTRTFSNRFNHEYKTEFFKEACVFSYDDTTLSIPSLTGAGKMSKSDNKNSAIYLLDTDKEIEKKLKRAVTDSGPTEPNSELSPEMINLFYFMELFSSKETYDEYLAAYKDCSIRYGDMKGQIAQDAIKYIAPIRENIMTYIENPKKTIEIAKTGAEIANKSGKETLDQMRDIMGLTSKNLKY